MLTGSKTVCDGCSFPRRQTLGVLAFSVLTLLLTAGGCAQPMMKIINSDPSLSKLNALLKEANVDTVLSDSDGMVTVFAPTDSAFAQLAPGRLPNLQEPGGRERLRSLLLAHLVKGKLSEGDLSNKSTLTSVSGRVLSVTGRGGSIVIERAAVIGHGEEASNGTLYRVDSVIAP